jgi:tetrachloro-p-hydroquinone reductive dehalogenase
VERYPSSQTGTSCETSNCAPYAGSKQRSDTAPPKSASVNAPRAIARSKRFAAKVIPIIREVQRAGAETLREIAEALNARGVSTPKGGKWYAGPAASSLERRREMQSLVLYNYTMSICSMKTRLAMNEFGLEFEDRQVDIGFALENFEPGYVRLNRKALVPTLVADGDVTTNSAEIVLKLAQLSGHGLPKVEAARKTAPDWYWTGDNVNFQVITYGRKGVPRGDELLVARKERAALYSTLYPELRDTYLEAHNRIVRHAESAVDVSGLAQADQELRATLTELDQQLDGKHFIAGDEYSVADVMWTVILARVEMLSLAELITERPNLLSYYESLKRRPSFEAARVMPNWKGGI